jgi:hypothetical protein
LARISTKASATYALLIKPLQFESRQRVFGDVVFVDDIRGIHTIGLDEGDLIGGPPGFFVM